MRICSLLPSATEIVYALGLGDQLVAVTHECDYPPAARSLPQVTRTNIPAGLGSGGIDAAVRAALETTGSLYELDFERLEQLAPDLILTQRLCDVCAVSADRVERSVAELPSRPRVLNLEPHSLADILDCIREVGRACGAEAAAGRVTAEMRRRIAAVAERAGGAERRRVACLEWVDPPYCGGHWMAELVEFAGGRDDLAQPGRPSRRIEWDQVTAFAPEILVLTCCGFPLDRCAQEARILARYPGAADLPAVRDGRVYATDGSAYFSRPGPRIVESLEILAHLVHPERFPPPPVENAFCAAEAAVRPNFSGTWELDVAGSDFGSLAAPDRQTWVLEHDEPKLVLRSSTRSAQGDLTSRRVYTTDGQENRNQVMIWEWRSTSRWEGNELVTATFYEMQGELVWMQERWRLSEDRGTLTASRRVKSNRGLAEQRLVYRRKPAGA